MIPLITHKILLQQLHYEPLTGIFTRLISNNKKFKMGDIAGHKNKDGYIIIIINKKSYKAHRLAWFYIHGYFPEYGIDHKDLIKHHNWISNLREATQQCNSQNTKNFKNNTSGIKGVSWYSNYKKWIACLYIKKQQKNLGYYEDFDDAVCARLAGEQCVDWAGCDSNSPAYQYVKNNIQDIQTRMKRKRND